MQELLECGYIQVESSQWEMEIIYFDETFKMAFADISICIFNRLTGDMYNVFYELFKPIWDQP